MTLKSSLLAQVPPDQSSLNYAVELTRIASTVGFDWPDVSGVIDKIHEELAEVQSELNQPDNQPRLAEEIGDLLFACCNLARHLNIDPELALKAGNQKFYQRFSKLEQIIQQNKQDIALCSLDELDSIWDRVKQQENKQY